MRFKGYSLEQLADIAKKQIKNKKYLGYFQTFNVGNMENNINIFNRASGASNLGGENISFNPSGMVGVEGDVGIGSGPMGESLNEDIEYAVENMQNLVKEIRKISSTSSYNFIFYKTKNSRIYGLEFFTSLLSQGNMEYKKLAAKLIKAAAYLGEEGSLTKPPYVEQIESNLYELRAKVGSDIVRMFYCFEGNNIYLFNGFVKKTQETPESEINKARQLQQECLGE